MTDHDGTIHNWRKSSYSSGGNGSCVEVGANLDTIAVRDTKDRTGGDLRFGRADWTAFVSRL